jgi:ABC-2 type transport system permease protein
MAANTELMRVQAWRPLRGFATLLHKENRAWWGTRRWWTNALLWSGGLGGLVALMLWVLPSMAELAGDASVAAAGEPLAFALEMGRSAFFELGTVALAIGVIVLLQDAIVDEKQSGVAEWLLAKPVARRSYILAKLIVAALAVLVLLIALPALAAYGLLSLRGGAPYPLAPFLAGLGIMSAHTLFYLTLTLMLGTLFGSRPPILGISLGVLLGGSLLISFLKPLVYITPWIMSKTAALAAAGQAVPPELLWPPLLSSALWCLIFVLIALAKFEKTEF